MKLLSKIFIACAVLGSLLVLPAQAADQALDKTVAKVFLASNEPVANPVDASKPVAKDLVLRGDAKCTACHDETDSPKLMSISQTKHGVTADGRTPTCTNCHGESVAHLGYKGSAKPPKPDRVFGKNTATPAAERNQACLSCHRGENRTHWEGSQHERNDVACSSCHQIHNAHDKVRQKSTQAEVCYTCHKEQRADSNKMSHHPIGEGKVVCSDCHNLHGSAGPKLLKKNTDNETCFQCHAEKRGPFLWEHQPATEDCSNCHTPHGSNITPLLKSRAPFMCQECHNGPHNSKTAVGPNAAGFPVNQPNATKTALLLSPSGSASGRGCMNCHAMVHGSNSPAGAFLHR